MRHRRLFLQMAGLAKTGLERRQQRIERRLERAQSEGRQKMALVEKIMAREVGAPGVKPMPGRQSDGG